MDKRHDEHEWRIALDEHEEFRREAARKLAPPNYPRPWAQKKKPTLLQRVRQFFGV